MEGPSTTPRTPSSTRTSTGAPLFGPGPDPGPQPPGTLGPSVSVGEVCAGMSYTQVLGSDTPQFVFSARTCIELVDCLSNKQIDTEINHLIALDAMVTSHINKPETNTFPVKRELLRKHIAKSLVLEVDSIVGKYDLLVQSLSRTVDVAKQQVDSQEKALVRVQQSHAQTKTPTIRQIQSSTESLEPPVRFSDTSFADVEYRDVIRNIEFGRTLPGDRSCAFFGIKSYSYGKISHTAVKYPANHPIMSRIFETISASDPSFTPQNYSCLINKYNNGKSTLAMHSDDEKSIKPGSKIYTVSFGAERTVRFYNTSGPMQDIRHKLPHGSLHIMTKESQSVWKHGLVPDAGVVEPRVLLTFRWLVDPDPSTTQRPSPPPPISQRNNQNTSHPSRILFLTDSVLSSTPEHIFEAVPNHVCVKQKEYQLTNIDKYSSQFGHTDVVILSMGINDLSRYGHNARSLLNSVTPKLLQYSRQYPRCKFIFNSLLLTRDYTWLNHEVKLFNSLMFDFTRRVRNVCFFDSHYFTEEICHSMNQSVYVEGRTMRNDQSNNGIHIALRLRRLITAELVSGVAILTGTAGVSVGHCKWIRNLDPHSA